MSVLLNRSYLGYQAGQTVELGKSAEDALIAQGLAQTALETATTTGNVIANTQHGKAAVAAGASSVVVTNSLVDVNSKVYAVVAQPTADTTAARVERVVTAAGSFTIYVTANATAATLIDWAIIPAVYTPGT